MRYLIDSGIPHRSLSVTTSSPDYVLEEQRLSNWLGVSCFLPKYVIFMCRGQILERLNGRFNQADLLSAAEHGGGLAASALLEDWTSKQVISSAIILWSASNRCHSPNNLQGLVSHLP